MTDNLITQSTDTHFEIYDITYTTGSQPLTQICGSHSISFNTD